MGCWMVYCPFCSMPMWTDIDSYEKENNNLPNNFGRIIKWLNRITILLPNGKIKHDFRVVGCNTEFKNDDGKKYNLYNTLWYKKNGDVVGLPIHTDCWKLAKKKHKFTYEDFDYSDTPSAFMYIFDNYTRFVDNVEDEIDISDFTKDDFYIFYSPLSDGKHSAKNRKEIEKAIGKFLQRIKGNKKSKERPSPSESATKYKIGFKKEGNDGNMWIIVVDKNNRKRWKKIK